MGYLILAEKLWEQPALEGAFNFGPNSNEAATVKEVIDIAKNLYGQENHVNFNSDIKGPHEANWLSLEIAKSKQLLDIQPRLTLKDAINKTVCWYVDLKKGMNAKYLCEKDIIDFEKAL